MSTASWVLVSGASGFIGRYLVPALQAQGYRVRAALRRPASGPWDEACLVGEIDSTTQWDAALDEVAYVIHLAALAHRSPREAHGLEDAYHRVNAEGTWQLADAARRSGVHRVVLVSSVAVTGSVASAPVHGATPPAPDSPYGRSKAAAESGLADCLGEGVPDWCILRPPLVYGPGNPGNMARLLRLLRLPIPLPLASIANRRSFCFVGNLASAASAVLSHPAASRQVFTVSDTEVVSTPELLRMLGRASGRPARLFAAPALALGALATVGDVLGHLVGREVGLDSFALDRLTGNLEVDASDLRRRLQWHPPYTLDEGLRLTLAHPS